MRITAIAHTHIEARQQWFLKAAAATVLLSLNRTVGPDNSKAASSNQSSHPPSPGFAIIKLSLSNWSWRWVSYDQYPPVDGDGEITHPHHQYLQGKRFRLMNSEAWPYSTHKYLAANILQTLSITPVRPLPLLSNKPRLRSGTPSKQYP